MKAESNQQAAAAFGALLQIMDRLRQECPWDKKQTLESLRHLTIEEMYELSDAILEQDLLELKQEIGDLIMHMVFYTRIGREKDAFNMQEVLQAINQKLIDRHPHIFGDVEVKDEHEVKKNWEKLKLREGKKSVLQGVPMGLPALVKSFRIQEKVAGVGFDWSHSDQVWDKIHEEIQELRAEIDPDRVQEEYGDLLFALVNLSRHLKVNPEDALEKANRKFIRRFQALEHLLQTEEKDISGQDLDTLNAYWDRVKRNEPL